MAHNFKGNCWDESVAYDKDGILNDICDEHDEPRGDCTQCPDCSACEDETSVKIFGKEHQRGQ